MQWLRAQMQALPRFELTICRLGHLDLNIIVCKVEGVTVPNL